MSSSDLGVTKTVHNADPSHVTLSVCQNKKRKNQRCDDSYLGFVPVDPQCDGQWNRDA